MSNINPEDVEKFINMTPVEAADIARAQGHDEETAHSIAGFFAEGNAARNTIDRDASFDVLKVVPGLDPVLAIVDGRSDEVPKEGWLVHAGIAPGYGGVINVYHYLDGLEVTSVSDDREKYHAVSVGLRLTKFGQHTIAYENPNYPNRDTEPFNRIGSASYTGLSFSDTESVGLGNGGRLLNETRPMEVRASMGSSFTIDWKDLDNSITREHAPSVDVNRVVEGREQVGAVLVALGAGMGLEMSDSRELVRAVAEKTANA